MKRFILSVIIMLSSLTNLTATLADYQQVACQWIKTYVEDNNGSLRITPQHLQFLLNLTYLSYERSASTLRAQEAALKATTASWQLLQNITQTRRNPSKPIPYRQSEDAYQKKMANAWKLQQHHQQIGEQYAAFTELVVINPDREIKEAVIDLRERARVILIDKLSDLRTHLQAIIEACNRDKSLEDATEQTLKRFALIDYITTLLPQLAVTSFVEADRLSVKASEEGWLVLAEIQRLDNQLWQMIETARASYYAAIYNQLYDCAKHHKLIPIWTIALVAQEVQLITIENEQLPARLNYLT